MQPVIGEIDEKINIHNKLSPEGIFIVPEPKNQIVQGQTTFTKPKYTSCLKHSIHDNQYHLILGKQKLPLTKNTI